MSSKKTHNEFSLPKWAQEVIFDLRVEKVNLSRELEQVRQAHSVLENRDWFTIPGPPQDTISEGQVYRLWYLSGSGAHMACALGIGDLVLVGRIKKETQDKPDPKNIEKV